MPRRIGKNDYAAIDTNGNEIGYRKTFVEAMLLEDVSRPVYRERCPVVYERSGAWPAKRVENQYKETLEAYRRIIRRGACVAFRYY